MHWMVKSLLTACFLIWILPATGTAGAATTADTAAKSLYFASTPALSPDGETVVFSCDNDLWTVPAKGGTAYRLTAMEGRESYPRFSPDGQWIAFSGSPLGNFDVYVMPAAGGEIRRLTYHSNDDRVDSWSWDSQYIYFISSRVNDFTEYKVAAKGGTPRRLFGHFFNMVHGLVEHPKTGAYFFTDSWESLFGANRKRYQGDFNPDIKSFHPQTGEFIVHTSYRGKDFSPTIDRDGNIYFVSDRFKDEYNLFILNGNTGNNDEVEQLTTFPTSIYAPCVSACGNRIVFEKDYRLFIYDVQSRQTAELPITLADHNPLSFAQDFNVKGEITGFDVSPDGKKMAFISRGELFVSGIDGKFIRKLETSGQGRLMEVNWLNDNRTLLFIQTAGGWLNLFKIRAGNKEKEQQLTFDTANNRNLSLNSDRTQAVYLSGRNYLKIIDLRTFKARTLVEDEFWGYYNSRPCFSPDDKYILYTAYRNFEKDIFLYDLGTAQTVNLTDSGVTEEDPFWSPDGKYIFFSADRYAPWYPHGGDENKIYRLGLQKYDQQYRMKEFDKLFTETTQKKDQEKSSKAPDKAKTVEAKPVITIDYTGLSKRWEQISPQAGGQAMPYVIAKDDEYTILYLSNHDGDKLNTWKTVIKPFEANKTEKIADAVTEELVIRKNADKYYVLVKGTVHELDLAKNSLKAITMDYTFRRNLAAEFSQMFDEVWANIEENFYDEKLHDTDWLKIKAQYREFLPYVHSRADLRRMINDMLGELGSSHMGFRSEGAEEKTFHKIVSNHTGILFDEDQPYRVRSIVPGSPADRTGIEVRAGDILTAVNDQPVDAQQNREYYFAVPSLDPEIKLTFNRGTQPLDVYIHPEDNGNFKRHLYDQWIQDNRDYVDKKSNRRIAYVHMKNMGNSELKNFLIGMTTEAYQKDALILDLRYNTGGNVHDAVLNFLAQKPYTQWKYRGGKFAPQPNFSPASKPIVLLVNEQSLSDAEMTAAGFKKLALGKIIGTGTYRWLIFTSGKDLVDGSAYRLPSWGCYTLDGENLEKTGVQPDIYVPCTLKDRLDGKDPQLDRAIDEIIKQLQ